MLVRSYLEGRDISDMDLEIENIEERISAVEREIDEIITTNPYLYRLLLNDDKEVERKKQEYRDEIDSYTQYSAQLQEVLDTFEIKEMLS